jgi:hypothetical protein
LPAPQGWAIRRGICYQTVIIIIKPKRHYEGDQKIAGIYLKAVSNLNIIYMHIYKRKEYQMETILIILIGITIGMFITNEWFKG